MLQKAVAAHNEGRFHDSEQAFFSVLRSTKEFALSEPDRANALQGLAVLYFSTGRFDAALHRICQAIEDLRGGWGEEHPQLPELYRVYCRICTKLGHLEQAEGAIRRAHTLDRDRRTQSHNQDRIENYLLLGDVLRNREDYDGANQCYSKAVDVCWETRGPFASETISILMKVANVYTEMTQYDYALQLYQDIISSVESGRAGTEFDCGPLFYNYGGALLESGEHRAALEAFGRSHEEAMRRLPPGHDVLGSIMFGRARAYLALGQYDAAAVLLEQCLEINTRVHGEVSMQVLATLHVLGTALDGCGRGERARQVHLRSQAIQKVLNSLSVDL